MFKVAISQPKIPPGADPKSVLCAFFKNGSCQKGDKCKFSHDMDIERKAAKKNIYEGKHPFFFVSKIPLFIFLLLDERDEKGEDTIEKWDDEKLANVVDSKHKGQITKSNKVTLDLMLSIFAHFNFLF